MPQHGVPIPGSNPRHDCQNMIVLEGLLSRKGIFLRESLIIKTLPSTQFPLLFECFSCRCLFDLRLGCLVGSGDSKSDSTQANFRFAGYRCKPLLYTENSAEKKNILADKDPVDRKESKDADWNDHLVLGPMAHIRHEIHLVDNLKAKFLMGMDILGLKQVIIDIPCRKLRFGSCQGISVPCEVKARDNVRIRRTVRTARKEVVPPRSTSKIAVTLKGKGDL